MAMHGADFFLVNLGWNTVHIVGLNRVRHKTHAFDRGSLVDSTRGRKKGVSLWRIRSTTAAHPRLLAPSPDDAHAEPLSVSW